jgi:drug/metabolite transporter (DMT)-like permease
MRVDSPITLDRNEQKGHAVARFDRDGWLSGLLGVAIFSGSLPATRVAVMGFSPLFLTSVRALIASLLATALIFGLRQPRPRGKQWQNVAIIAAGCVIGFPFLTALALQTTTAAHSLIYVALLPLLTAIFGVIRGGERPKVVFWLFAIVGAAVVMSFAASRGAGGLSAGDLWMICAIIACGLGYAEGAILTRTLGGWQVISWSLIVSAPAAAVGTLLFWPEQGLLDIRTAQWLALGYVSTFSMLIGFVFWYRGLSLGGIASIGQLQLLQPFMGLALAWALLGERISVSLIVVAATVVVCVACSRRFA